MSYLLKNWKKVTENEITKNSLQCCIYKNLNEWFTY